MVTPVRAGHAGNMDQVNRTELAAFLRRRRAWVQPTDVGLASGGAGGRPACDGGRWPSWLDGMSVDYYNRLEQGRVPRPSREMITAIGRALRLSADELAYLHHLVREVPAPLPGPVREVRPGVLHLLDRLDDTPAMV